MYKNLNRKITNLHGAFVPNRVSRYLSTAAIEMILFLVLKSHFSDARRRQLLLYKRVDTLEKETIIHSSCEMKIISI